jgi:asparagine synthase (glutamine-hydrolysing)
MKKTLVFTHLIRLLFTNPYVFYIVFRVWKGKLSLLGPSVLAELSESISTVENKNVAGIFIEAGCALGGSALVIAASRRRPRPFYVYDTFAGIPAPSMRDGKEEWNRYNLIVTKQARGIGNDKYYGYQENLLQRVEKSFNDFGMPIVHSNIYLIKGVFQDTLNITDQVAFAHIDSDWYDSVKVCLAQIEPFLALGGQIVIDDYYYWCGCRKAVEDYFADKRERYRFTQRQRLHITRIR